MAFVQTLRGQTVSTLTAGLIVVCVVFFGVFALVRQSHIVTYTRLQEKFIPGMHGVILIHPQVTVRPQFDPWKPLEQNRLLEDMVQRLCLEAGLLETCATDAGVRFELFTKGHRVGTEENSVELVRGTMPLPEEISSPLLDERLSLMAKWAHQNQSRDGVYPYLYHPSSGEFPEGSNVIRTMITVQGLFALGAYQEDEALLAKARHSLNSALALSYRYDREKGYAYMVEDDGEVKLGATALTILALREGKESSEALTEQEKALGAYLLSMQREDGSFQTFLHDPETDENERFYSGEALTAIAVLSSASDNPAYEEALVKSLPYYREKITADFYPQYAPWHIQAYAIAYQKTPNEEYAAYVYYLADQLILTMLEEDDTALPDEEGRFFNPDHPEWGPPHSSSAGIYTEGLTYALDLAQLRADFERSEKYRAAVMSGTRALLHVQWTPESAYYLKYPDRVVGALKRTVTDNRHRVDQIGHALNALVRVRMFAF